jgi:hypothetical protein
MYIDELGSDVVVVVVVIVVVVAEKRWSRVQFDTHVIRYTKRLHIHREPILQCSPELCD